MSLPILKATTALSADALARQFVQSESVISQSLCEPLAIDVSAFCEPSLAPLPRANRVLDAFVADVAAADEQINQVDRAFAAAGSACREWSFNPTTPADVQVKLQRLIERIGFQKQPRDLLLLHQTPKWGEPTGELQVIPGRANPVGVERLFADSDLPHAAVVGRAAGRWVDEPRLDSLLALERSQPVGYVAVLTLGQVGRLMDLFVAPTHRGRGIGSELIRRAMEICARSLFHHVFASEEDASSRRLIERFGFRQAATVAQYRNTV